jgi:hypothetical protein
VRDPLGVGLGLPDKRLQPSAELRGGRLFEVVVDLACVDQVAALAPADTEATSGRRRRSPRPARRFAVGDSRTCLDAPSIVSNLLERVRLVVTASGENPDRLNPPGSRRHPLDRRREQAARIAEIADHLGTPQGRRCLEPLAPEKVWPEVGVLRDSRKAYPFKISLLLRCPP